MNKPIYTEKTQCQDCYKCVRECPVKAIRVIDGSAQVMAEACILCGRCTEVCPVGAKKIRDDLKAAMLLLKQKSRVYVSPRSHLSDGV
ncbi:MAG: 4Fe-4S binding protein [Candidatus Cloacimonetes bacterium]|nr:4Fe-4S binding protein [Candidatus Cloacimonadota bacterium]